MVNEKRVKEWRGPPSPASTLLRYTGHPFRGLCSAGEERESVHPVLLFLLTDDRFRRHRLRRCYRWGSSRETVPVPHDPVRVFRFGHSPRSWGTDGSPEESFLVSTSPGLLRDLTDSWITKTPVPRKVRVLSCQTPFGVYSR